MRQGGKKTLASHPRNKKELDSLLSYAINIQFYSGQILNSSGAINFLITIDKKILNSPERDNLMLDILLECENFVNKTGIELRYAGLPYSRYVMAESVKKELNLFLVLSICITAVILYFFFRYLTSIKNVIFKINPDVESMEGAACMMVSERFGIPFLQIRGISNHVEQRNTENWDLSFAISNLNTEVERIIDSL
mgnify:CR=1 FL=1